MRAQIAHAVDRVATTMWLVPTLITVFGVVLAIGAQCFDQIAGSRDLGIERVLYNGDLSAGRDLLIAIAGSVMTVAGVTFSVIMVALSVTSTQYGPRLLRNFMHDRGNQVVWGLLMATYVYCLTSLATIPGQQEPGTGIGAAVSGAMLLSLMSLAALIYLFHHATTSITAEHAAEAVAGELTASLERFFPAKPAAVQDDTLPPAREARHMITAERSGYIQAIDAGALAKLAGTGDIVFRACTRAGRFVDRGEPLLAVEGTPRRPSHLSRRARRYVIMGRHRTPEQDPEYGIRQLVEMAGRALSPGINDPFTAVLCIDWLESILCRIAPRPMQRNVYRDDAGRCRVILEDVPFESLLRTGMDLLRHYSSGTPVVANRLLDALGHVARHTRDSDRRNAIREQADTLLAAATANRLQPYDAAMLNERYAKVMEELGRPKA